MFKNKFNRVKKWIKNKAKCVSLKFRTFLNYIKYLISNINWNKITLDALIIFKKINYYILVIILAIPYIIGITFYFIYIIISTPYKYTIRSTKYINHKLLISFSLIFLCFIYFNLSKLPLSESNPGILIFMVIYLYVASIPLILLLYFLYIYNFFLLPLILLILTGIYEVMSRFNFWLKYSLVCPMTTQEFFTFSVYITVLYIFFKTLEKRSYILMLYLDRWKSLYTIQLLIVFLVIFLVSIDNIIFDNKFMLVFFIFVVAYCYTLLRSCIKAHTFKYKDKDICLLFNCIKFILVVYTLLKITGVSPIHYNLKPRILISEDLKIILQRESLQYTLDAIPDDLKWDLLNKSRMDLYNTLKVVDKFVLRKELEYVCDLHTLLNSNSLDVNDLWNNFTQCLRTRFELFRLQAFRYGVQHAISSIS